MAKGTKIGSLNLIQSTPITRPTGRWCALFTRDEVFKVKTILIVCCFIDNLATPYESTLTAYFCVVSYYTGEVNPVKL